MAKGKDQAEEQDQAQGPSPVEAEIPDLDVDSLPSATDVGAGSREGGLWPNLPRVPFKEVLGVDIAFMEWRIMPSTKFADSEFAVILFTAMGDVNAEVKEGTVATTSTGSGVIVDRLHRATGPFRGRVRRHPEADYYEFVD